MIRVNRFCSGLRSTAALFFFRLSTFRTTAGLLSFLLCVSASAFAYDLTPAEAKLLNKIERDTLQYFLQQSDINTGLVKDNSRPGSPASIAATGFGLAAFAIGADRGWISHDLAKKKILAALITLGTRASHKNGFFYHFLDMRTGKRTWSSEVSSIDTALLVAGALTAAQYYPGTEIEKRALKIYARVDWKWMLNNSDLICMGWKPESGFLPYYWDSYNELLILQALALGSPTHATPAETWNAWSRFEDEYQGHKVVYSHSGSLFTYQYPHAFIDFRNLNDAGINYFENSVQASLANREYSLSFDKEFKSYNVYSWGLSAADGAGGYKAYGGKPGQGIHDGTVAPHAAIGSLPFTPKESLTAIKFFYLKLGTRIYKKYGFTDAFNIDKKFYSNEYLGIDEGIVVLMLENFTNDGALWKKFMEMDCIKRWIKLTRLQKSSAPAAQPEQANKKAAELISRGKKKTTNEEEPPAVVSL